VRLEVASGIELPPAEAHHATELVAYLTFHPGANEADIRAALWPARHHTTKAQRALVSQARRWLGVDASGQEHLPRSAAWPGAAPTDRDTGRYHLRGVDSDWGRFLELVGDDIALTHTTRLVAALDLVHGSAFQGVPARRYAWAQGLVEELTASVVDVAHEVARRSLLTGELRTARYAAAVGRSADLLDERPWRDAIRTEWADGRTADVEELIEAMSDRVEGAGLELQPETEDLIEQVRQVGATRRAGRQLRGA
jgi:hypothetical protein